MVGQASALSSPLHAHLWFVDQSGRALVWRTYEQTHPARSLPQRERTRSGHSEYIEIHNERPKPFTWTRTADQILNSIARYAQRPLPIPLRDLCHEPLGRD